MTRQQAKQSFYQGTLMPKCPECGSPYVQWAKRIVINRTVPAMSLVCKICTERFYAWIA